MIRNRGAAGTERTGPSLLRRCSRCAVVVVFPPFSRERSLARGDNRRFRFFPLPRCVLLGFRRARGCVGEGVSELRRRRRHQPVGYDAQPVASDRHPPERQQRRDPVEHPEGSREGDELRIVRLDWIVGLELPDLVSSPETLLDGVPLDHDPGRRRFEPNLVEEVHPEDNEEGARKVMPTVVVHQGTARGCSDRDDEKDRRKPKVDREEPGLEPSEDVPRKGLEGYDPRDEAHPRGASEPRGHRQKVDRRFRLVGGRTEEEDLGHDSESKSESMAVLPLSLFSRFFFVFFVVVVVFFRNKRNPGRWW
mmetsp:Transcript_11980/g.28417  ORF Transcript_11980/g.28417 Transcript_11980/m.28417 type:complete len:307 (+) Transcript_11980:70-990(+)